MAKRSVFQRELCELGLFFHLLQQGLDLTSQQGLAGTRCALGSEAPQFDNRGRRTLHRNAHDRRIVGYVNQSGPVLLLLLFSISWS